MWYVYLVYVDYILLYTYISIRLLSACGPQFVSPGCTDYNMSVSTRVEG